MKHLFITYIMKETKKNLEKNYQFKIVKFVLIMQKFKDCKDNTLKANKIKKFQKK